MPDPFSKTESNLSLRDILSPIWAERKKIVIISLVVAFVTLGVNFLLPKSYRASSVILPESDRTKLGSMSSLAGLASMAGVNVSGGEMSRLYPVILASETVLTAVIQRKYATDRFKDSVDLIQYFELDEGSVAKNLDEALKLMKDLMSTSFDVKTNIVTASVEMREPRLAAVVMNTALSELDLFLREKRSNSATEQRKWIESRRIQVSVELRNAEEALKNFRERNRRVSDSPQLLLEQDRLAREVQVKGTIDLELRKQAEIAKIDEIKQVTTINVLDEGREPVKKDRPKRATNAAIAFFVSLLCSSSFFATRSLYGDRIREYMRSMA